MAASWVGGMVADAATSFVTPYIASGGEFVGGAVASVGNSINSVGERVNQAISTYGNTAKDYGNAIKDWSGAPGSRVASAVNPLALSGTAAAGRRAFQGGKTFAGPALQAIKAPAVQAMKALPAPVSKSTAVKPKVQAHAPATVKSAPRTATPPKTVTSPKTATQPKTAAPPKTVAPRIAPKAAAPPAFTLATKPPGTANPVPAVAAKRTLKPTVSNQPATAAATKPNPIGVMKKVKISPESKPRSTKKPSAKPALTAAGANPLGL